MGISISDVVVRLQHWKLEIGNWKFFQKTPIAGSFLILFFLLCNLLRQCPHVYRGDGIRMILYIL